MTVPFLSGPLSDHEFDTECDFNEHLRRQHDGHILHHGPSQSSDGGDRGDIYEEQARQGKRAYGVSISNQHQSYHSATGSRRHSFDNVRILLFFRMGYSNTCRHPFHFSNCGWASSFTSPSLGASHLTTSVHSFLCFATTKHPFLALSSFVNFLSHKHSACSLRTHNLFVFPIFILLSQRWLADTF